MIRWQCTGGYLHGDREPGGHSRDFGSVWRDKEKLPIGLQILGRHFDEGMVLRVAGAFERNR